MIVIEEMKLEHVDEIVEIERSCFSVPWSKKSFIDEIIKNNLAVYYTAVDYAKKKVIGYVGMWQILNEAHITNVAVESEYRGKGIATRLLKKLIEYCLKNDIDSITLEVRESNINALNLYNKLGFEKAGVRKNYYKNPRENAIIMWKKI